MIYKALSEQYGWTPDQINDLTLFQAAVYLGAITPEHGRVKMTPAESSKYMQFLKSQS